MPKSTSLHSIDYLVNDLSRQDTLDLIEKLVKKLKNSDTIPKKSKVDINSFSFTESQEVLKDYPGSISETIIEERRSYL